jgi:hypothetical protein
LSDGDAAGARSDARPGLQDAAAAAALVPIAPVAPSLPTPEPRAQPPSRTVSAAAVPPPADALRPGLPGAGAGSSPIAAPKTPEARGMSMADVVADTRCAVPSCFAEGGLMLTDGGRRDGAGKARTMSPRASEQLMRVAPREVGDGPDSTPPAPVSMLKSLGFVFRIFCSD